MELPEFLSKLKGVKQNGTGHVARCPAHEDKSPSLCISKGTDGRILLKCQAGCSTLAVVGALNLQIKDLFAKTKRGAKSQGLSIVASYDYRAANGKLIYQVVRFEPKDFRQRKPDGKGGWTWKLENIQRVLYRLPEIIEAVKRRETIFICEGEKDVAALEKHGLNATCNAGGAGKFPDTNALDGADIVIIADKDKPGREHAKKVSDTLKKKAKSVRIVELPDVEGQPVKDAHDFFTAGGSKQELLDPMASAGAEVSAALPAYYDLSRKSFWAMNDRGEWIPFNDGALANILASRGFSKHQLSKDGKGLTPCDRAMMDIQMKQDVSYAGSLAGHKAGFAVVCNQTRVLVTNSPRIIEAKPGKFPVIEEFLSSLFGSEFLQLERAIGWLSNSYLTLVEGGEYPAPLLAIAGEVGCGKSRFQALVTELLGGRSAKPYRYMVGETSFNSDLFAAEHLMIEDEAQSKDKRSRERLGAMIKNLLFNPTQSCHGKRMNALSLNPFWRMTMTLNNEVDSLLVMPAIEKETRDKILLLSANMASNLPGDSNDEKKAWWNSILAELPAFVAYLKKFKIPKQIAHPRTGVAGWQHPVLLSALDTLAKETRLLELIDSSDLISKVDGEWIGTATELERALIKFDSSTGITRNLFDHTAACGKMLSKLQAKFPDRFSSKPASGGISRWTIKEK